MDTVGSGLLAFLMSDVVGSTAAWESDPEGMAASIAHHDEIIQRLSHANDGQLVKSRGEGDSHFITFPNARDAVACALEIHSALAVTQWPGPALQVRIAIHLGEAITRSGDYYGPTVNRCARIRALAAGGQLLVSDAVHRVLQEFHGREWRFVDLGPHRLKDLLRPERIWQVQDLKSPISFEPLRSFSNTPNNLPIQLTEFVGRKRDVEDVQDLARRHRLVTLLGAGGSGKTRLAMQVAAEMADDFSDGVWWIDLVSVESNESQLAPVFNKALGIPPVEGLPPEETLGRWIDGKHSLLVLDNCEQIASGIAKLAIDILSRSKSIHLLATSRHTLNAPGEQVYTVPTLSFPPRGLSLNATNCLSFESIELLVERAQMRDRKFVPTDANAPFLAEICRRLDGLPLAIELAAPKLGFLGPEAMVRRLDDVFRLLHGTASPSLARHQTIETAIAWSYDLLSKEEQTLFQRLSIFVSPWTLEEAEAICGFEPLHPDEALEQLMGLRDKSLIHPVHGESVDRHALLEPIRQFAERRLRQTGEEPLIARRLTDWFTARAIEGEGPAGAEWLETLNTEYESARRALQFAIDQGLTSQAYDLVIGLRRIWLHQSMYGEAFRFIDAVLGMPPHHDPNVIARVKNLRGVMAWFKGDWDQAERYVGEALSIWRSQGADSLAAGAIINLGLIARRRGAIDQARELIGEGLRVADASGNIANVINAMGNLAALERDIGHFEEAVKIFREALDRFGTQLDEMLRITITGNLASCLVMLGEIDQARPLLAQALRGSLRNLDKDRLAANLENVAWLSLDRNSSLALDCVIAVERLRLEVAAEEREGFERELRQKIQQALAERLKDAPQGVKGVVSVDAVVQDAILWLESRSEPTATSGRR